MQLETAVQQEIQEDPSERAESQLIQAMGKFFANPYGFVLFAYHDYWEKLRQQDPGQVLGAGPDAGPDEWQTEVLLAIGAEVESAIKGERKTAIRIAVKSGHGPGKTAVMAWLNHWFLSTRPHPQSVVTANTKTQLESKTWRELAIWWKRSVHEHWFDHRATKFYLRAHPKTWFSEAVPWSKERPEAFMGTHEKYVLMLFDEASAVDDSIWEAAEGAMTTPGAMWIVFGNPTRNIGKFKECWGVQRNRWKSFTVNSLNAKMSNKEELNDWIQTYGENSDFCRVKVFGDFPSTSSLQFIGEDLVLQAFQRHTEAEADPAIFRNAPIILGVDIARHGDDKTVIVPRQGVYLHPIVKFQVPDLMKVANLIAEKIRKYTPAATCVDAGGMGRGVIDKLRQMGYRVTPVDSAGTAVNEVKYANRRAELWDSYRSWLKEGGAVPEDKELLADSTGIEYGFDRKDRLLMEKKELMKKRGLASPDIADAICQTFAVILGPDVREDSGRIQKRAIIDYDEFAEMPDPYNPFN